MRNVAPTVPAAWTLAEASAALHDRVQYKRWWSKDGEIGPWLAVLVARFPGVIDVRDDGNTPLHVALDIYWRNGVLALLQHGADPLLVNALGQNARTVWERQGDDLDAPVQRALEAAELRALACGMGETSSRERVRL